MNKDDLLVINFKRAEIIADIVNNTDPGTFVDFDTAFYNKMSESKAKGENLWIGEGEEEFYRKGALSKGQLPKAKAFGLNSDVQRKS